MMKNYLLVPVVFVLVSTSFAGTYYVGTCRASSYTTISAAVAAVPPNSTIYVCPGTYPEQVFIYQPLTLQGITSGNSDRARIVVPTVVGGVPTWQFVPDPDAGVSGLVAPQIFVFSMSGTVTINNLTIDASGETAAPACYASGFWFTTAIMYQDSSGTVSEVNTVGQGKHSGCGKGIWAAVVAAPSSASVTISKNSIQDANDTGLRVESIYSGASLEINVTGNTLVVSGSEGIEYAGVTGTISSNFIEAPQTGIVDLNGFAVGPLAISNNTLHATSPALAQGINVAGTGDPGRTVSGNRVVGFFVGIALPPNSPGPVAINVNSNVIVNSQTGIDFDCGSGATLTGNIIQNAKVGLGDVPTGFPITGVEFYNVGQIKSGGVCFP